MAYSIQDRVIQVHIREKIEAVGFSLESLDTQRLSYTGRYSRLLDIKFQNLIICQVCSRLNVRLLFSLNFPSSL